MNLLVVEDDIVFARTVARALALSGWQIHLTHNTNDAVSALEAQHFDAMLLDLRLNDESGLELLKHWSGRFDLPATVLLSGCVDVPTTVRAMRIGVVDVLQKPVDTDKLDQRLRAAVATRNAGTNGSGEEESEPLDSILGEAAIVELLRRDLQDVAQLDAKLVLLVGETGTGKEHIARVLHATSRKEQPFIALNCATVPADRLEHELFGAVIPSDDLVLGTLATARAGTVFLDEVDNMPTALQARLTQALEQQVFSRVGDRTPQPLRARVIAASRSQHRDPPTPIAAAATRILRLPSLREHPGDIPLLAQSFLAHLARRHPQIASKLSEHALQVLKGYDFPGNVRELQAVLQQAALMSAGVEVTHDAVQSALNERRANAQTAKPEEGKPHQSGLRDLERDIILEAFTTNGHNLSLTARMLGIPRTTLRDKLRRYGVR